MAGKRQVPRDERRASLLQAAADVFAHKGYHDATVDDITRAAGVAKGTFYLYFEEKKEIYHEVIHAFLQLVKDIGRSVGVAAQRHDFMAMAEAAALELMKVFLANRELARMAYRESMGLDAELEALLRGFYREIAEVEAENIRLGITLGLFRADVNPLVAAYAHIGMAERVLLEIMEQTRDLPPPETIVKELVALAIRGLKID